jgi:hypothetical protein
MAWMRCSYWLPAAIVAIILLAPAWGTVDSGYRRYQLASSSSSGGGGGGRRRRRRLVALLKTDRRTC